MKTHRFWLMLLAVAVLALVTNGASAAAAGDEQEVKVGKTGEVMFTTEIRIGDVTLVPGHYRLEHHTEGSDHFVQFTLMKGIHNPNEPGRPTGFAEAGKIKCRLEPLNQKVRQTTVYSREEDGRRRVARILVAGENVAHLF